MKPSADLSIMIKLDKILVAEITGELVGLVRMIFILTLGQSQEICYLQDLFVIPQNRGKKIGQLLIESVYERADKYGATSVWLMKLMCQRENFTIELQI